jgi:gliding motility-associated-like protein
MKKKLPIILCLVGLLQLFLIDKARGQTDNEFWFVAPEVSSSSALNLPIYLRLITKSQPATVTISQPASGGMPPQTLAIPANTLQTLDLTQWIDDLECKPANAVLNFGIHIVSNTPINAYYEVNGSNLNPEIFVLKGANALGTSFVIPGQNFTPNSNLPVYAVIPYSSFDIVATQDNTVITINPKKNIVGHAANVPFTVTLNKGQVYSATAASQLASEHLQGSQVSSNHPVAITVKDDLMMNVAYGPCADLAGDQTVPTNLVGTKYIAVNGNLNAPNDQMFITAVQNGTQISKNGTLLTTINAFETYQTNIGGLSCYIETSNPAYAYQVTGIGCEFGSAVLPPIECTGNYATTIARSTNEDLYITLLVQSTGIGNFQLNGAASALITAAQFAAVPGTGNSWYAAKIMIPLSSYPAGSIITISNSTDLFHEGILNGSGSTGASVGYFSNYNNATNPDIFVTDTVLCNGGTVTLNSNYSGTPQWTGPDNFSSTASIVTINNMTSTQSGYYHLHVVIPGCGSGDDSVHISVIPPDNTTINQNICNGVSYLGHTQSGNYIDTFLNITGCDSIVHLSLNVIQPVEIDTSVTMCTGGSLWGHTKAGTYTSNFTTTTGCDSIVHLTLSLNPVSCDCQMFVPNAFSPNGDTKNDVFRIMSNNNCGLYNFSLSVYDRWGQRVFLSNNPNQGWDGTFNHKEMEVGTYFYYIEYSNLDTKASPIKTLKGDLTLVR